MPAREAMSGADAAWFHMDRDHNLMVVNTVLCFDQPPDWNRVEALLRTRMVDRFPRFRQRGIDPLVTFGLLAPWWEEDASFDIEHHLARVDLSARGSREALDEHIAMQAGLDLDRRLPLWRAELIDLAGGAAALLLRTHHAIGDGAALLKVITALTDPLGEPPPPPRPPAPRPWNPVDPVTVERTVIASANLSQRLFGRGASGAPLTSPIVGEKQIAHLEPIELRHLKDAGRSTESTVNDVFLGALAGALREHFAGLGVTPDDVDIVMPVSVRDDHEERDALGNRFGLVFGRLPVATADPRERRARVTQRTRAIKSSQEPEVVFGALSTMGHVPRAMQHAWVDAFIKDAVAVVTNVQGPRHAVSLAGTPVTQMYFFVPSTGPIGLGISFLSYNGHAVVSLIADRATLPALQPFAAQLESELRQR